MSLIGASRCLESLPVDALVAILSASNSLSDLHAFIRASPWLYQVFLSSKRAILLEIVVRETGPAIRDYFALSTLPLLYRDHQYHVAGALDALRKYEELLTGAKPAIGIAVEQVIDIIQFKRTVDFFVDVYEYTRLLLLKSINPAAATPLSRSEYQRLSRAFVRHQIFTRLYPRQCFAMNQLPLGEGLFGLFEAWEMEQISVAHAFVFTFFAALHPPRWDSVCFQRDCPTSPVCESVGCYPDDLTAVRHQFSSLISTDAKFMESFKRIFKHRDSRRGLGVWGGYDTLNASHGYNARIMSAGDHPLSLDAFKEAESLWWSEKAKPKLCAGLGADEPPFAWVDAMQGLNCRRWGEDLDLCFCEDECANYCYGLLEDLAKWRKLGFVFWG
ncbi:hypothetical protein PG994_014491 [Apiospora phragmitis]|uniref:F-box domain-containing protein n=1 Tax=Apiospora phragmitis TaxID=2905665 RepID=A0ABR1T4G9_9PEZI